MPRMTRAEYDALLARQSKPEMVSDYASVDEESKLHDQILAECARRRWYVVHGRMDRRSTVGVGTPDFIIAADGGRIFWIEAKAKTTKVSTEQAAAHHWLIRLDHSTHIVRSFKAFLDIVS